MELQDLEPIITLITEQENRLVRKIDEVHEDVLITNSVIRDQNGRLRTVEVAQAKSITGCAAKHKVIDEKFVTVKTTYENKVKPNMKASKFLLVISKNPKLSLALFLFVILSSQTVVMAAFQNQWIGTIFKSLLP
jgi:hypothetical protein